MVTNNTSPVHLLFFALLLFTLLGSPAIESASAHFGMLIPEAPVINQDNRATRLTLSFSHPFELIGMNLDRPAQFSVTVNGSTTDLLPTLQSDTTMDSQSWSTDYNFKRPGVYQFVMEPQPYWESAEDVSIIHYTKVIVPAYGEDQGWDEPLGLPVEIVPLLRPFGNYAGNTFVGQVLINGKPASSTEVEVELFNDHHTLSPPSDYHITQVVKSDPNGIFTFTCPAAGWWGFAALSEAGYTIKDPQGKDKGVELGAVLWVYFDKLSIQQN